VARRQQDGVHPVDEFVYERACRIRVLIPYGGEIVFKVAERMP
jgi:hypothetical protein